MNNLENTIEPLSGETAEQFLKRLIDNELKDVEPSKREARRKEFIEVVLNYFEKEKEEEEKAIRYKAQESDKQELLKASPEEKLCELKRFFNTCKMIIEEQNTLALLLKFFSDGPLDNILYCTYESRKDENGFPVSWIKPADQYFYYMMEKLKIEPFNLNFISVTLDLEKIAKRDMQFINILKDDTFEQFLRYYGHPDISHYEFVKELEEKMPTKDIANKKLKI